ncbi:MAG: hypothetical protein ACRD0J_16615, partial [Acidimicrobiales bacterium]
MPAAPVQLEFAVEFASFLVAAAGFSLVLLRAELLARSPRDGVTLAAGFAGLAAVAFLHGSLLVPDGTAPGVLAVRGAGLLLLLLGTIGRRRTGEGSRATAPGVAPAPPVGLADPSS